MTRSSTEGRTAAPRDPFKDPRPKKGAGRTPDTPTAVQLGEHGRYQIKSGRLSGEYIARAFPKPPTTARGLIAEARGATQEAAIAALHDVIDARETRRTEGRRISPDTGLMIPSTEEYAEALDQVALSQPQRAMLAALALADEDGVSDMRLARAAGYKSDASANRALASAGLLIASYLSLDPIPAAGAGDPDGTSVLGYRGAPRTGDDTGHWILHAELRAAVRTGR